MKLLKSSLEKLMLIESAIARRWVAAAHRRLMFVQWALPPKPLYFDHRIDLFYKWISTRDSMWVERGVFSSLAIRGGSVLELSCGDGFNARNFYSLRANSIIAVDIDKHAIAQANANHAAPNIAYQVFDIRRSIPEGNFDNIIWDFGFPLLEFFTESEIVNILKNVKLRLNGTGIFSGYTVAQSPNIAQISSTLHFSSTHDLKSFLLQFFDKVMVFETKTAERVNLYFWASDAALPLSI